LIRCSGVRLGILVLAVSLKAIATKNILTPRIYPPENLGLSATPPTDNSPQPFRYSAIPATTQIMASVIEIGQQ